jgi:hypothetical protein
MAEQKIDTNLLIFGGLFLGGYYVINAILKKLKIVDDPKDTAAAEKAAKELKDQEFTLNIWGGLPTMVKAAGSKRTIKVLTVAGADSYAKQIYNSWGYTNDDEEQIFGVFRNLRFKTQVGSVVSAYFKLFKKDLLTDLKTRLSTEEFNTLISIIETKPSGIDKI